MNLDDSRVDDLARRGVDGLAEILRRRPDLATPAPMSLEELLARMDRRASVKHVIDQLSLPLWQLLAAVCSLDSLPLSQLGRHFPVDPIGHLRELHASGLLDLEEADDRVNVAEGVLGLNTDPLRLGPNLYEIAANAAPEFVRAAAFAFGCGSRSNGRDSIVALSDAYLDDHRVRRALDGLPPALVGILRNVASGEVPGYSQRTPMSGFANRALGKALAVGRRRGLLIALTHDADPLCVMPAEVRLALRGPGYLLPYAVEPLVVAWLPLSRAEDDARAAVLAFDAAATAVLDDVHRRPLVPVQAGGIGTRELKRLTKATQLQEATVRIVLELAAHAGLVSDTWGQVVTSDSYLAWRESEPAERFALLARTWWGFPGRPSESLDRFGAPGRPLTSARCAECRLQHTSLLDVLRPDVGVSLDDAAELASWHRPAAHVTPPPYAAAWSEATTLGVIVQGALSPVGMALREGDHDALRAACAALLPSSTPTATFGSDLTALAVGTPTARVSGVLDACADRESAGGAVTWRLSRESVRRALDGGWAVSDLRDALTEIAGDAPLPAAVTVLLDDVERTYGRAVVHTALAVVVAADEVEAAALQHDRRLESLRLTAVTPTVFASARDAATTLATLRRAGHSPRRRGDAIDDLTPDGVSARALRTAREAIERAASASEARTPRRTRERSVEPPVPPDVVALARSLLDAPRAGPPEVSRTETSRHPDHDRPPGPTPGELQALWRALDSAGRVEIVYRDAEGSITERVVRPRELTGGMLEAWCELRSAERDFVVGRILAVRAV